MSTGATTVEIASDSVLLVEDDVLLRYFFDRVIRGTGSTSVVATAYGEEALEMVKAHRPWVVFMDMKLSGVMEGVDAAKQIRDYAGTAIRIVYLSAYDPSMFDRGDMDDLFDAFLVKPVVRRDIERVLQRDAV